MKTFNLTTVLALAVLLGLGASRPMAQTTETIGTSGPYAGDVINSTYTFSGVDPNGSDSFTATLDQTTIPDLNDLNPSVQFQLGITSFTLTDTGDDFVGTGIPTVTLTFQVQPNAQQGGNFPSITVTLVGNQSINGSYQASASNPLTFSLESATPPTVSVTEMTPGNAGTQDNEGTGTFPETITNFEPSNGSPILGNGFTVGGSNILNYQAQNQVFSVGGTLEVIYAVPEPRSGVLAFVAGLGFVVLVIRRRFALNLNTTRNSHANVT